MWSLKQKLHTFELKNTVEAAPTEPELAAQPSKDHIELSLPANVDVVDEHAEVNDGVDKPLEVKMVAGTHLTATENLDSPVIGKSRN